MIKYLSIGLLASIAANALLFGAWQNAREAVIEEREGCNVEHLEAALAAEQAARLADAENHQQQIQDMLTLLEKQRRARLQAEGAAANAEKRAAQTKTIIKRADDACLDTAIPADILGSLRD